MQPELKPKRHRRTKAEMIQLFPERASIPPKKKQIPPELAEARRKKSLERQRIYHKNKSGVKFLERYHNDDAYRQQCIAACKRRYDEKKEELKRLNEMVGQMHRLLSPRPD